MPLDKVWIKNKSIWDGNRWGQAIHGTVRLGRNKKTNQLKKKVDEEFDLMTWPRQHNLGLSLTANVGTGLKKSTTLWLGLLSVADWGTMLKKKSERTFFLLGCWFAEMCLTVFSVVYFLHPSCVWAALAVLQWMNCKAVFLFHILSLCPGRYKGTVVIGLPQIKAFWGSSLSMFDSQQDNNPGCHLWPPPPSRTAMNWWVTVNAVHVISVKQFSQNHWMV